MSPVSYVLDTSALLAHYFNEPGAELMEKLWADESLRIAISAVSVAELKGRLQHELTDDAEAKNAADAYLNELTTGPKESAPCAGLCRQIALPVS